MTELNRLIGQLDNIAERTEAGVSEKYDAESIREAASILRAAASVDVAGLMELAEAISNAAYASAVDDVNGAGADSTKEVEAEAALESALRMALAAREWQPIETAPKDGRQLILLLTPSGLPQVAYSNTWWTAGFSVECKPTHWIPLPAAAPKGTP